MRRLHERFAEGFPGGLKHDLDARAIDNAELCLPRGRLRIQRTQGLLQSGDWTVRIARAPGVSEKASVAKEVTAQDSLRSVFFLIHASTACWLKRQSDPTLKAGRLSVLKRR